MNNNNMVRLLRNPLSYCCISPVSFGASQNCSTPASFDGSSELHSENRPLKHFITFRFFTIFVAVAFFLLTSLPFLYVSSCNSSHHRLGDLYGVRSNNSSILGLKSNPFSSRVKDTVFALKEQLTQASKQGAWIAAKSIPENDGKPTPLEFEDPKLYHYAAFSHNVLAASVVMNSAVNNSKNPSQHFFHIVTDKVNFWAMQVMFKMKDYSGAHIEVKVVEDFKFFNSSYVPVLLMSQCFLCPIVQRDLTGLWKIDMDGKVNGAVETCFGSFYRYR
uniref:Hexosyltransferase n=1 Tax=Solanum lycopersicum TaxID=4081 RepID=A0A3Q7I4C3_SOLLC